MQLVFHLYAAKSHLESIDCHVYMIDIVQGFNLQMFAFVVAIELDKRAAAK